jgi:hypothetical protein
MSDEPQPLRLKPRPPPGGEVPPPPEAPASVPAPVEPADGTGRLRLKPRLIVTDEAAEVAAQSVRAPDFPTAPPVSEAPPPAPASAGPLAEDLPVFKLRPKAKPGALAPPPPFESPASGLPEPPSFAEATSTPVSAENLPPEPPSGRSPTTMPPVSVLSGAPPPEPGGTPAVGEAPEPGAAPEPPAVPGSVPRLSMGGPAPGGAGAPPGVKPGLNLKVSSPPAVKGGRPPVVKPGKPPKVGSVLRKRSALGPVAKVGIGVVVLMLVAAGIFFFPVLFPRPSKPVAVKAPAVSKPVVKDAAAAAAAKAAVDAAKLADAGAAKGVSEQEKADADARDAPAPTPAPAPGTESVMGQSSISSDVKVNNTELNAAPAASPAFRTFVAGASIGGVFQGTPARALVNGAVVREGQVVESSLGISFDRIDSDHKMIYFKDATGAEVSKNY